MGVNTKQLEKIITAYKVGDNNITISGKKYSISKLTEFQIFTHEIEITPQEFNKMLIKNGNIRTDLFGGNYIKPELLGRAGKNVTDEFIGDTAYGEDIFADIEGAEVRIKEYVDLERIKALEEIGSGYDFAKLIVLCKELNDNFSRGNYYAVGLIGRTILDHIPPVFGMNTFKEVANNYGKGGKSFSKNMKHLESSLRNISDGFLHTQIRKKEVLPNKTQVNFSQDLDVLFAEIIRIS